MASAATVNIWSTTFDTGNFEDTGPFPNSGLTLTLGGAAVTPSELFPGFGTNYLRNTTTGTTSFGVTGLAGHTDLHLSFDLAFVDSWDGPLAGPFGPDFLNLSFDGVPLQLSDPGQYGPGVVVATGSFGQNPSFEDNVVHYDFVIAHNAANFTFALNAGGGGFQGGQDESWGIDNFSLSATPAVTGGIPEPATWALMIAGFGLAGTALRRRGRAVA